MKIRIKIILVILPLVLSSLLLYQRAAEYSARLGITRIAQSFLNFKAQELEKYAEGQWNLLFENNYTNRPDMVEAAKNVVMLYAKSIIRSGTEVIIALDDEGSTIMATSHLEIGQDEREEVLSLLKKEEAFMLRQAKLGGEKRVFSAFYFTPFRWYILLTETSYTFFKDADRIRTDTLIALFAISFIAIVTMILFSRHLTNPLERVVKAMNAISSGSDLSSRVEIEYRDETGKLASTFNRMIAELEKAYMHIKRYAFEAVLAGKKEQRIRQIFQKYVPKDLIDKFFASPESMLVGENRELAILFSDIRSFTTISENMAPNELVNSLNRYFSGQVDIIMNRNGIVDKYIGDAIMAFWGAPVKHSDDALQAVFSGLDMIEAVKGFNENQKKIGKCEFHIGIGINYGTVTVGNIGSERKMDYTVIGDMVNLASRMEGLTKTYHSEILISESLYNVLAAGHEKPKLYFRFLDTVAVKGKTKGVKIYTVCKSLAEEAARAWAFHNKGMELYNLKDFTGAAKMFQAVLTMLPGDFNAGNILERCKKYSISPPPPNWDGVEVMHTK
jgi:class 3 adenylate cyclase/HAMP domain-containing protein